MPLLWAWQWSGLTANDLTRSAAVMAQAATDDPAEGTSREIGPTSTRLQRILDLWFDEPNLRHNLPGPKRVTQRPEDRGTDEIKQPGRRLSGPTDISTA